MKTITEFTNLYGIRFTLNHTGKMAGLASLSTSPLCNGLCQKRVSDPGMVCSKCFSHAMQKRYSGLKKLLIKNSESALTREIIPESDMPRLYSETGYFRFESFGDLVNAIQAANYIGMAAANPHMKCALWTKNPWFIQEAIDKYNVSIPENLCIIGSSYYLNNPMDKLYGHYDFIDYIFTVYNKSGLTAGNVAVTCGARSCAACGKCYEKRHESRYIVEKLK